MLLTIVTVNYNRSEGLRHTYKSIAEFLPSFDCEWLVIDGQSTDGSVEFLHGLDVPNLRFLVETDQGIYDAMNKGIEQSKGKWLWFLNSGDRFSGCIDSATLREHLTSNKTTGLFFNSLWDNGKNFKNRYDICSLRLPNHQALVCRRSFLKASPFLAEKFPISADIPHKYHLIKNNDFGYVDEILVVSERGGVSQKRLSIYEYIERIKERYYLHKFLKTGTLCRFTTILFAIKLFFSLN